MPARTMVSAIAVVMLLSLGGSPFSAALLAQASCTQEMNRQDAALRQFDADVRRESLSFAADDARRVVLDDMKAKLKGDPTADAAEEVKAKWDEYNKYMEQAKTFQEIMAELSQCMKSGALGCLDDLIRKNTETGRLLGKVNDAVNKWIESLGNDSITKAAERVERARGVMDKFANNAANMATGAMSGAMNNCFRDLDQRVQQAQNSNPVDLSQPSQPRNSGNSGGNNAGNSGGSSGGGASGGGAAASGGGSGVGTAVGIGAAIAGGSVGAYYIGKELQQAKCNQYQTEADSKVNSVISAANSLAACGSSVSCANSRLASVNSALTSLNTTLGNWCNCLGGVGSSLSSSDKAEVQDALSSLRALGVGTGTLPACFR